MQYEKNGLSLMKSKPTRPAFSGAYGVPPRGTPRSTESTPTRPDPQTLGPRLGLPVAGLRSGHNIIGLKRFSKIIVYLSNKVLNDISR